MRDRMGRDCCGFSCLISNGDLDGVACAKTWQRVDGTTGYFYTHATGESAALWRDPTPLPAGVTAWQVAVDVEIELFTGFHAGAVDIRLVGGLLDCNNYVFCEVIQRRPASGLSYMEFRLGRVDDGVETILARHSRDAAGCVALPGHSEAGYTVQPRFRDLWLCWDGATLFGALARYAGPPWPVALASQTTPPGSQCGVATGQLSAEVKRVIFHNVRLSRADTDDSEGVPCGDTGKHCCGSPVPLTAVVEISGVASGTASLATCVGACNVLAGTYALPALTELPSAGGSFDCAGDAICQWSKTMIGGGPPIECTLATIPPTVLTFPLNLTVFLSTFWQNGYRLANLTVFHGGLNCYLLNGFAVVPGACEDVTDWVDGLSVGTQCSGCDVSGIRWRFKMVP
jgi:hypothetical protein